MTLSLKLKWNENFCLTHNPNDRDAFNCWSINRSSFNFGHGVISMYSGHKLRLEFDLKFVRKSPCDTKIRHILHTPRIRVTQILKFSHLLHNTHHSICLEDSIAMWLLVLGKSRTSQIFKKSHMYFPIKIWNASGELGPCGLCDNLERVLSYNMSTNCLTLFEF